MKVLLMLGAGLLFTCAHTHATAPLLSENGEARAEIIVSDKPQRSTRLAAQELQDQIAKISGARLPILTKPTGKAVKVFVGESAQSPVNADGLRHGAYRIVSGPDWLALVGDDTDFTPAEPFAQNNSDIKRAQAEWKRLTDSHWGIPSPGLYKHRLRLPGHLGKPEGSATDKNETLEVWGLDERGSFNAVCGFLHKLGARWYMPGELGEVLPVIPTIALPPIDETVRPDFALRQFNFRFGTVGPATAQWAMRLGIRNDEKFQIAHGMDTMTGNEATFAAHPEWFALYGGKRHYTPGSSKNQLCYSNEEFFWDTVRFARTMLDRYPLESVSIMPPDGYTAICQCGECGGKDSPERGDRGLLSDYVWDFVNRVAREVGRTHPRAKVLNCAYGAYTLPPLKIDKLEPNVLVAIVGGRRPINKAGNKAEGAAAPEALREAWVRKTDNPVLIFENYPFTDRGWYLPAFAAHALGDTVNASKGISQGEDIWLTVRQDFDRVGIGFNHFLVYFTARMYWGGKNGPAEREMLDFFTYCEANWAAMEEDKEKADSALALFEKAKAVADAASVYGRRIALVDEFLKGLRMKSLQLGQKRGPVPVVRLVGDARDIVIDGKLDDSYWRNCPAAATGRFRELQTGRPPLFGTTYKAGWQGNSLCLAIRCDERPGEKPRDTATGNGDQALWYGDAVEIEIATESHAYYLIAVSPSGFVVSLDRGAPRSRWFSWDARAEVATQIAEDHWTVEIRIPVTESENDPLHQVIGRKPTQSLPWHINLCRQRICEDGTELSALSPTGTATFHETLKFAHFYHGRSHTFEADTHVTDFVIGLREASKLRTPEEALPALLALSEGAFTDYQKSAALEQAAAAAAALKDFDRADALGARIPIPAVRKTVHMQNLLARMKAPEVVAQFAEEEIGMWPFWKRGDGYLARGRGYLLSKNYEQAGADFTRALEWLGDERSRKAAQQGLQSAQIGN
jgi:hypothetical protein